MQDETGRMHLMDELPDAMKLILDTNPDAAPVVQVGDVFKIRDCHFEITVILPEGIIAKGIRRGEFIKKKFGT